MEVDAILSQVQDLISRSLVVFTYLACSERLTCPGVDRSLRLRLSQHLFLFFRARGLAESIERGPWKILPSRPA